nr:FAD-linked sulfhydryl oxidase ERV1 [Tanacetum cinerariifolium]
MLSTYSVFLLTLLHLHCLYFEAYLSEFSSAGMHCLDSYDVIGRKHTHPHGFFEFPHKESQDRALIIAFYMPISYTFSRYSDGASPIVSLIVLVPANTIQYPEKPTRQQKKDVKELMAILSRIYPCQECADHFKEVLRSNPVNAGSQAEFSQWLCRVHNVVNRSLGKPAFPCERVDARWGKLDCEHRLCDLQGSMTLFGSRND